MIHSLIGGIHTVAAILALLFGSLVLSLRKGSRLHRRLGYFYVLSMAILLITSFGIYHLHGGFGMLHVFSLISSATLLGGMIPLWLKRPSDSYLKYHLNFMYWSVIGLYCAFSAEIFTRLPFQLEVERHQMVYFYILVGVSSGLTAWAGSYFFRRYKADWERQVDRGNPEENGPSIL